VFNRQEDKEKLNFVKSDDEINPQFYKIRFSLSSCFSLSSWWLNTNRTHS